MAATGTPPELRRIRRLIAATTPNEQPGCRGNIDIVRRNRRADQLATEGTRASFIGGRFAYPRIVFAGRAEVIACAESVDVPERDRSA